MSAKKKLDKYEKPEKVMISVIITPLALAVMDEQIKKLEYPSRNKYLNDLLLLQGEED